MVAPVVESRVIAPRWKSLRRRAASAYSTVTGQTQAAARPTEVQVSGQDRAEYRVGVRRRRPVHVAARELQGPASGDPDLVGARVAQPPGRPAQGCLSGPDGAVHPVCSGGRRPVDGPAWKSLYLPPPAAARSSVSGKRNAEPHTHRPVLGPLRPGPRQPRTPLKFEEPA